MKKKLVFPAMLVCLAVLGLVLVGCPMDPGDPGGSGIDTAKLEGTWLRDDNSGHTLIFDSYNEHMGIGFGYTDGVHSGGGSRDVNGDVIGDDEGSFKVAFEGEKLKVSEGKGDFATFNGTYTKQRADDDENNGNASGGGNSLVGSWEKGYNTLTFTETTWTFLFGDESGAYALSGTSLTMKDSDNVTYTGTVAFGGSTVTFSGFTGMLGDEGFGMNGAWTKEAE
jgi:hypothetical protein